MSHSSKGTALVTGGAIRIGQSIALGLAQSGYDIALHYHASEKDAKNTQEQIFALGQTCSLFQEDLGQNPFSLIEDVFKTHPDCNILINNAAIFEKVPFLDTNEDIFDRHMDLNFKAPFFLTQTFATHCSSGNIINILDSDVSKIGQAHFSYLLSKKSLLALTEMTAKNLGPNIRVNAINLGSILPSDSYSAKELNIHEQQLPLQKRASIEEVMHTIHYLLENNSITGEALSIDGGKHLL